MEANFHFCLHPVSPSHYSLWAFSVSHTSLCTKRFSTHFSTHSVQLRKVCCWHCLTVNGQPAAVWPFAIITTACLLLAAFTGQLLLVDGLMPLVSLPTESAFFPPSYFNESRSAL
uniref:Uncharacterized protein n=1 Tax=Eutreptiella gymnastica TaxID=73025 RepID=A0A7S4CYZ4_9EUGL